jgi:protein phosphatase
MKIDIPELSAVVLMGSSDKERASFAEKHFKPEEILCANDFREPDLGAEKDQNPTEHRGEQGLYQMIEDRLASAKLTVIDIGTGQNKDRKRMVELAKRYHCFPVAIVLNIPEAEEEKTYQNGELEKEGFRYVYLLNSQEEIQMAEIVRSKLYNNKRDIHGPFDIIGDIHGCYDELCELLEKLGYRVERDKYMACSSQGRTAVFVGDLVDRGPKSMEVLKLVMAMVKSGKAYCTLGNHDGKLQRKLNGSNVQITHGLEETLGQMSRETEAFIEDVKAFLKGLISHYVFDEGRLVVAHAGLKEKLHGRGSRKIRDLAMFGETTGKTDEFGLPIRLNWAKAYYGKAFVVYGHTPHEEVQMINNTVNIDTGCVFGGKLTALRYPEIDIVDVKAKAIYYEPARPLFYGSF